MAMIDADTMKEFVDNHSSLISVKIQGEDLFVLKYKNKVFYESLWTPEMCELRGTVVDSQFNIVQRPFTKIFNYGESGAPLFDDSDTVIATTKINGFMAAATWFNDDLLVSTTGSIISDFAEMARGWLLPYSEMFKTHNEYTFIFEIVDPADPHVIVEAPGAWLLGARRKEWDSTNHSLTEDDLDQLAIGYNLLRPDWKETTFGQVKDDVRKAEHEGFVVYSTVDQREIKFKSPFYLATKFFGRKTADRLNDILDDPREAKKIIDEEYYPVIDHLSTMKDEFIAMDEQARFAYLREYFVRNIL